MSRICEAVCKSPEAAAAAAPPPPATLTLAQVDAEAAHPLSSKYATKLGSDETTYIGGGSAGGGGGAVAPPLFRLIQRDLDRFEHPKSFKKKLGQEEFLNSLKEVKIKDAIDQEQGELLLKQQRLQATATAKGSSSSSSAVRMVAKRMVAKRLAGERLEARNMKEALLQRFLCQVLCAWSFSSSSV